MSAAGLLLLASAFVVFAGSGLGEPVVFLIGEGVYVAGYLIALAAPRLKDKAFLRTRRGAGPDDTCPDAEEPGWPRRRQRLPADPPWTGLPGNLGQWTARAAEACVLGETARPVWQEAEQHVPPIATRGDRPVPLDHGEIQAMVHLITCDLPEIVEPVLASQLRRRNATPLDAEDFARLLDLHAHLTAAGHAEALAAEAAFAPEAARALAAVNAHSDILRAAIARQRSSPGCRKGQRRR